jgi:NMD protein affecting ribosome stability and mRNA decay
MTLSSFCPGCGKETENLYGDKGLCRDCFLEKGGFEDTPDAIKLEVCKSCSKTRIGQEWKDFSDRQKQVEAVLERLEDYGTSVQTVDGDTADIEVSKEGLSYETQIPIEKEEVRCRHCNEFEGFPKTEIQVRGHGSGKLSDLVERRSKSLEKENHDDFLVESNDVSGGRDFYLSTEHMAQKVLETVKHEHDVEVERTYEQIGTEDGQKLFRNVVSIRLS